MEKILVADVMTRDPILVKPETNLFECAKQMVRKRVGFLLLVEKNKLVGVIARKDILWVIVKKPNQDLSKVKAIDVSPRKIATIRPNASIKEALSKMKKFKFDRLPVIQEGELVGIITARDIFNFNPELYPELEEFARIREETQKLKRIKKAKDRREGVCEDCGKFDVLYSVHGSLICEDCKNSM